MRRTAKTADHHTSDRRLFFQIDQKIDNSAAAVPADRGRIKPDAVILAA